MLLYLHFHNAEKDFLFKNIAHFSTILTILSIITGLLIENIGSRIEVSIYDKKNRKEDPDYIKTWGKFLLIKYEGSEPIGQRYLRNILLRMKFELSFALALIIMAIGLVFLDIEQTIFVSYYAKFFGFYFFPLIFSFYLFCEGYSSSKVLAETRKKLVGKYGDKEPPISDEKDIAVQ